MQPKNPDADVFVPDGNSVTEALAKTTHLAVGAHQGDIEFMALHGVMECFHRDDSWFSGVTVTNGVRGPGVGPYESCSDGDLRKIRASEQRKAALVGDYACLIQLGLSSDAIQDGSNEEATVYLKAIFEGAAPDVVYLHNPADKNDAHVACCLRSIAALRVLAPDKRPTVVYGCEVLRGLDWLLDEDKHLMSLEEPTNLTEVLCGVYDSLISAGRRFDLAVGGRHVANAAFHRPDGEDVYHRLGFAMDLTPLVADPSLDVADYTLGLLRNLKDDITDRIVRMNRKA